MTDAGLWEELPLLPHHRDMLIASGIAPQVAKARGYYSETERKGLLKLGFSEMQAQVPALVIPVWNIYGNVVMHFIRPDVARIDRDGKTVKYDRPSGTKNVLDVNPATPRAWLNDVTKPLIITEGQKKIDALVSAGYCAAGLLGVWGFRTKGEGGHRNRNLAEFIDLPMNGRLIYPIFDSDLAEKEGVYHALLEFGEVLDKYGGVVRFPVIPPGPAGAKVGVDDYMQDGGVLNDLLTLATDHPPEPADYSRHEPINRFWAMPEAHRCIYTPTGALWPVESVNKTVKRRKERGGWVKAADWLMVHRAVQQRTWVPGEEQIIEGRLATAEGWVEVEGARVFNTYTPPIERDGDAGKAGPWRELVEALYPEHAEHIFDWFAQRVQQPGVKPNHALVFGGAPGVGKDTLLAPVVQAVGPGNFGDVSPVQAMGRFNAHIRNVILRVSELRDLGEMNRYTFYEHMKTLTAAPPEFLMYEEKYAPKTPVPNVVGIVYTTNNRTDGLFIPPDDRRHYVMWSEKQMNWAEPGYFREFYRWLCEDDGFGHVAAFLRERDISEYDPKAPPLRTREFLEVVDAARSPEEGMLEDLLDELEWPDVVTIPELLTQANRERSAAMALASMNTPLVKFLTDPKTLRQVPRRLESVGYVRELNRDRKDGRWVISGKRERLFVSKELTRPERNKAILAYIDRKGREAEGMDS